MAGINLKLGVSPAFQDPRYSYELQAVYNAVNMLGAYASVLKEGGTAGSSGGSGGVDGEAPNISLPFINIIYGIAIQPIAAGSIVSFLNGGIANGVLSSTPASSFVDPAFTVGSTGNRTLAGVIPQQFFVALAAANPGDQLPLGVGPGITKLSGAKCGNVVWAVDSQSVFTTRNAGSNIQTFVKRDPVGNGGLYLQNVLGSYTFGSGGGYNWEGYWLPGFPNTGRSDSQYNRAYLFPVGVCVKDDFVLFSDYKRSDPLPFSTIPKG